MKKKQSKLAKKILGVFHAIGRGLGFILAIFGSIGAGMASGVTESSKEISNNNEKSKKKEEGHQITMMPSSFNK